MIIDGKALAAKEKEQIKQQIVNLKKENIHPKMVVVLVGNDPASIAYCNSKQKACDAVGMLSETIQLDESARREEVIGVIEKLNQDAGVHGILLQLPLPGHLDEFDIYSHILPEKDLDGFHIANAGLLLKGQDCYTPCTPSAVMALLKAYDIPIEGKNCVIIGRSNIVGKPMAHLMLKENATVTICHSKTKDLPSVIRQGDIVIAAVGRARMITADMIKEQAVVMDVGINYDEAGKMCGDVDFDSVKEKASYITPVPGGVGPMTIVMLMKNCMKASVKA